MKLKTSKQLVQEAMDKIKTISPSELKDLQKQKPDLVLIDIRDIRELKKQENFRSKTYAKRNARVLVRPRKPVL